MNRRSSVECAYLAHADAVRARLRRLGFEPDDVDDLCQDVFETALAPGSSFAEHEKGSARRWLLDTARKLAANERRLFRHEYEVRDIRAVNYAIAEPEDPEREMALRELVHKATSKLDGTDRIIVIYYHLEGASLRELANALRVRRSTAFVRMRKVTVRLRGILNAHAEGEAA